MSRLEMSRLKGKPFAIGATIIIVLLALVYVYRLVPGYFHAVFYDHETFRDCSDCPEMVVIPSGNFMMGNSNRAPDEKPRHLVTFDYTFAVGKFEVTQAEWRAIMGNGPSRFRRDDLPVERVSWIDAQDFVEALNVKTNEKYRLLSEAEWEYMARAGTTTDWSCGDQDTCVNLAGWHLGNSYSNNPVGQKIANGFGVHDIHGNVWEWVEDCYDFTYDGAPVNGSARQTSNARTDPNEPCERVMRGGSTFTAPWRMRTARRFRNLAENKFLNVGFRVAKTLNVAD